MGAERMMIRTQRTKDCSGFSLRITACRIPKSVDSTSVCVGVWEGAQVGGEVQGLKSLGLGLKEASLWGLGCDSGICVICGPGCRPLWCGRRGG